MYFDSYTSKLRKVVENKSKLESSVIKFLNFDFNNFYVNFIMKDDMHELSFLLKEAAGIKRMLKYCEKNCDEDSYIIIQKFNGSYEVISMLYSKIMRQTIFNQQMDLILSKEKSVYRILDYIYMNPNSKPIDIAEDLNIDRLHVISFILELENIGCIEGIHIDSTYNTNQYSVSIDGYEYINKLKEGRNKENEN